MTFAYRFLFGVAFLLGAYISGIIVDRNLPFQTAVITAAGPLHPRTVQNLKTLIPTFRGGFFRLSIPKVTEMVIATPGVQTVQLERVWLGRQLRIRVVPESVIGRWNSDHLITSGGRLISDDWTTGLPIISAPAGASPDEVVKALLYAQTQFRRFNETLTVFEVSSSHQVCLTVGQRRIQVGALANLEQAMQRFLAYRAGAQEKYPDWEYMDLRYNAGYVLRAPATGKTQQKS